MKELKALEILKTYHCPDEHGYVRPVMVTEPYLLEAIAELEGLLSLDDFRLQEIAVLNSELEALQAPKTCNGCKIKDSIHHCSC